MFIEISIIILHSLYNSCTLKNEFSHVGVELTNNISKGKNISYVKH